MSSREYYLERINKILKRNKVLKLIEKLIENLDRCIIHEHTELLNFRLLRKKSQAQKLY